MTFLAKLGAILAKVVTVVTGVEPIVNSVLPNSVQQKIAPVESAVTSELTDIAGELAAAEQAAQSVQATGGNLTDLQKAAIAQPYISQIVLSSPLLANKKIVNESLFQAGLSDLAQAIETIVNSAESK